jgi:hypothetical protein
MNEWLVAKCFEEVNETSDCTEPQEFLKLLSNYYRGANIFQNSRDHLDILGGRMVK